MATLMPKPRLGPYANNDCEQVTFLHPGYPDGQNVLLILPAVDNGGIHHGTALSACAILANSRWDGFFSTTRYGRPIQEPAGDVLSSRQYYFRIQDDDQYPVVPCFDHFSCPTTLPTPWALMTTPAAHTTATEDEVVNRDKSCRITAFHEPNEVALVIPESQSEWWQRNSMFKHTYNPDPSTGIRSADNAILLRSDMHQLWDNHRFVIVPKLLDWVVHVIWKSPCEDLEKEYHNVEMQELRGVSKHALLCKFALAIFSKSLFLNQGRPRKLLTIGSDGKTQVRMYSFDEYKSFLPPTPAANSPSQSSDGQGQQRPQQQRSAQDNRQDNGRVVINLLDDDDDEEVSSPSQSSGREQQSVQDTKQGNDKVAISPSQTPGRQLRSAQGGRQDNGEVVKSPRPSQAPGRQQQLVQINEQHHDEAAQPSVEFNGEIEFNGGAVFSPSRTLGRRTPGSRMQSVLSNDRIMQLQSVQNHDQWANIPSQTPERQQLVRVDGRGHNEVMRPSATVSPNRNTRSQMQIQRLVQTDEQDRGQARQPSIQVNGGVRLLQRSVQPNGQVMQRSVQANGQFTLQANTVAGVVHNITVEHEVLPLPRKRLRSSRPIHR